MTSLVVAAARPNFMKVAPIIRALEVAGLPYRLVHTGQHYDERMSATFFDELGIPAPDVHLDCGGGTHAEVTARVMLGLEPVMMEVRPAHVVVVGDVNSTLAAALTASKLGIPVAHVEAGLRSWDREMPEELNRICTDHLSDWLFTTSEDASTQLLSEGIARERVFTVGNVMIDTLVRNVSRVRPELVGEMGLVAGEFVLATLHRPSNVDDAETLASLLATLDEIGARMPVLLPVHPRTASKIDRPTQNVRFIEPLSYLDFLCLMMNAYAVVTDSGGIQEETTALGVPCLTVRNSTERPITVEQGSNTVVGTSHGRIIEAFDAIMPGTAYAKPALWDGKAAERIVSVLSSTPPPLNVQRSTKA